MKRFSVFLFIGVLTVHAQSQSITSYESKVKAMASYLGFSVTSSQVETLASLQRKTEFSGNPENQRIESFQALLFQYAKLLNKDTLGLQSALQSWASRRTVKFNLPVFENLSYTSTPLNSLSEVVKLGTGPVPVILIPEYRKDWTIFQDYVERNLTKYTFYAITLPGYHRTNPYPLPAVYDFSNRVWLNSVAEGVISLIQKEKLERPLLVGALNAGSYVATRVASRVPDQVRGVVLLNGALREGTDEKSFNMSATQRSDQVNGDFSSIIWYLLTRYMYSESELDVLMTRNLPSSHPIFYYTHDTLKVKRVYRMHNAFPSLLERYDLEWLTADLAEDVKRLRVPMLVVLSIYDSAWPFEPAMNHLTGQWKKFVLENGLENIRITEIENARLVLMLEAPDIVGKAIDAFLENKVVPNRYLH